MGITSQAPRIIERVSFPCSSVWSCLSCPSCLSMFPNATNRFNGTCSYSRKANKLDCREGLCPPGARASRPHKTWQGRGDWLHRVGRFTCLPAPGQRLYKNAGGTPALPGGNPRPAKCRSEFLQKVLSNDPPRSGGRGGTCLKQLRVIHKGKKKSTKGHEGVGEGSRGIRQRSGREERLDSSSGLGRALDYSSTSFTSVSNCR